MVDRRGWKDLILEAPASTFMHRAESTSLGKNIDRLNVLSASEVAETILYSDLHINFISRSVEIQLMSLKPYTCHFQQNILYRQRKESFPSYLETLPSPRSAVSS